jgi:hypothetical protein
MAWQIHYLDRNNQRQQLSVVAVAAGLQREGLLVETIQADTGMTLTSRDVRWLRDANEAWLRVGSRT